LAPKGGVAFPLPPEWGVHVYLKDESIHPTGSRKHRLARSLFLYAVVSGQIATGTNLWGVSCWPLGCWPRGGAASCR
jgi:cysteine synthase